MSLDVDLNRISLNDNGHTECTINFADHELFETNHKIELFEIFCFSR
jgi:hypothetical protein